MQNEMNAFMKRCTLISPCCLFLLDVGKHLPQTHLGRLEAESLLSLHSTLVSFTGPEFQCRTRQCESVSTAEHRHRSFVAERVVRPHQGPSYIINLSNILWGVKVMSNLEKKKRSAIHQQANDFFVFVFVFERDYVSSKSTVRIKVYGFLSSSIMCFLKKKNLWLTWNARWNVSTLWIYLTQPSVNNL